jgi:hypothetical protein
MYAQSCTEVRGRTEVLEDEVEAGLFEKVA